MGRQEKIMEQLGVEKVYSEKLSGKNTDRPQLKAMLGFVREGDIIYVESISRLARSTKDLLNILGELAARKVDFISDKEKIDTTTPQGRFMLTVFAALSELERETLLQRQREGIAVAKEKGVEFGRPRLVLPENWDEVVGDWRQGRMMTKDAIDRLGITRSSFYKQVNACA
jgi:DNA invertase Pin-like site-specific DNA recombinase